MAQSAPDISCRHLRAERWPASQKAISMSDFKLSTLPAPLGQYFGTEDHAAVAALFDANATVIDEGQTHHGHAEISGWLAGVEARYQPRYRVEAAQVHGTEAHITVEVSGAFPGSPIVLTQAFTLNANARIERLETL